jgi:hypothetical protein
MNTIKIRNLKKTYLKPETLVHKINLNEPPEIKKTDLFTDKNTIEIFKNIPPAPEFITDKNRLIPVATATTKQSLKKPKLNFGKKNKKELLPGSILRSAKKEKIEFQYPVYNDNLPRNLESIYLAIKNNFPLLERKHIFLSRYFPNFPVSHVSQLYAENKNLCGKFIFNY